MSKKTVWFIALLLTTLPSFAQFRAGVKGGGNISSMNMTMGNVELDIHDPRFGVHGGLMGEYMFSGVFGLQAELSYYYWQTSTPQDTRKGWMFRRDSPWKGMLAGTCFIYPLPENEVQAL